MELMKKRCNYCNFYKCSIHSLSINGFSQDIFNCNCSFIDYLWKIKNKNAFKIFIELLLIYIEKVNNNGNGNNSKIDRTIEKLIYTIFYEKDIILYENNNLISLQANIIEESKNKININYENNILKNDKNNSNNDLFDSQNNKIKLNYFDKKINGEKASEICIEENINENYIAFKVIKFWLKENLNNLYEKKLNIILNKLNWYLECFLFNSNQISSNELKGL